MDTHEITPATLPMIFPDDTARARRTDLDTSHAAADSTAHIIAASQRAVAHILEDAQRPLTDKQIIHRAHFSYGYHYSESRLRTARHELVEAGAVADAGTVRPFGEKRSMHLWAVIAA